MPIEITRWLSNTGRQVTPLFVDFQMPPPAAAAKKVFDGDGMPTTSEFGPSCSPGRHSASESRRSSSSRARMPWAVRRGPARRRSRRDRTLRRQRARPWSDVRNHGPRKGWERRGGNEREDELDYLAPVPHARSRRGQLRKRDTPWEIARRMDTAKGALYAMPCLASLDHPTVSLSLSNYFPLLYLGLPSQRRREHSRPAFRSSTRSLAVR